MSVITLCGSAGTARGRAGTHTPCTQTPAGRALALPRVPPMWDCHLLTVPSSPLHGPALVRAGTSSLRALISPVLALGPSPVGGRALGTSALGTGDGEHFPEKIIRNRVWREDRKGHAGWTCGQSRTQTAPATFFLFYLYFLLLVSPRYTAPLLSPPLFPSLNILSKMLFPNRESCSCRQFLPISQVSWAESLPWTHLEGSHPAHGLAVPSDNQEGPGQGNPLAPSNLMHFTSHSYHGPSASLFFYHGTQQTFE